MRIDVFLPMRRHLTPQNDFNENADWSIVNN
jgi:hypothetical protein